MTRIVFLGSEASVAGFRLAGFDARIAVEGAEGEGLATAREGADLVIVEASVAARVPMPQWRAAVVDATPLVAAIPDLAGTTCVPDLGARLRRQLGLAEDA